MPVWCQCRAAAIRAADVPLCPLQPAFSTIAALSIRFGHPPIGAAYLLAVLPAFPIMGALVVTGLYLAEEKDEFQRQLLVESVLGGIGDYTGWHHGVGLPGELRPCSASASDMGLPHFLGGRRHFLPVCVDEVQMKNRLRVLRAERDWSQAELAHRLEVSRQSVNAIETGKFDPSLTLAFKLSRLFGMPIEELFVEDAEQG